MVAWGAGQGGNRRAEYPPKRILDPQEFGAVLAGLCRFYGGTIATYLAMPIYQLRVLVEFQPAIDAEEQQALALAASSPHMKPGDRRQYSRALEALARPRRRRNEPAEALEIIEYNPALAGQWFASQGIKVNNG